MSLRLYINLEINWLESNAYPAVTQFPVRLKLIALVDTRQEVLPLTDKLILIIFGEPLMKSASVISTLLTATSVVLVVSEMPAHAFNIGMVNLSNNTPDDIAGHIDISVDVVPGTDIVQFNVTNTGTIKTSITDIYFGKDNVISDVLGSITGIINTVGVNFSEVAVSSPSSTDNFKWNSQVKANNIDDGIDVGETLAIQFNPKNTSFVDIQNAFLQDRTLAIGMQVQNTDSTGGSYWLSSNPFIEPAPEPLTILGTGVAFSFGGLLKREYDKKKAKTRIKN